MQLNPCKRNPHPTVCYLHVLTRWQGKACALPKKSCQGFWRLFCKGMLFGRLRFPTNCQELLTLCIYPPRNPQHHQEPVHHKNAVYDNSCSQVNPATYQEHPHDLDRAIFWKSCSGKTCINPCTLDLTRDGIDRHLLEVTSETWNLQRYRLFNGGRYADGCSPLEVDKPKHLAGRKARKHHLIWPISATLKKGDCMCKIKWGANTQS